MEEYLSHPAVAGVIIGGSSAVGEADKYSDTDVYVLTTGAIDLQWRRSFIERRNPARYTLAPGHFGDGDAWEDERGVWDVMFWDLRGTLDDLRSVVIDHRPSVGYSTAFWHTILSWKELGRTETGGRVLDELLELAGGPYPDELAKAIALYNRQVIRGVMFSYEDQLAAASMRGDTVSINHRTTAILASWFDIVFAVNRETNPGEKRLLDHLALLENVPAGATKDIEELLTADVSAAPAACGRLIDRLELWLEDQDV